MKRGWLQRLTRACAAGLLGAGVVSGCVGRSLPIADHASVEVAASRVPAEVWFPRTPGLRAARATIDGTPATEWRTVELVNELMNELEVGSGDDPRAWRVQVEDDAKGVRTLSQRLMLRRRDDGAIVLLQLYNAERDSTLHPEAELVVLPGVVLLEASPQERWTLVGQASGRIVEGTGEARDAKVRSYLWVERADTDGAVVHTRLDIQTGPARIRREVRFQLERLEWSWRVARESRTFTVRAGPIVIQRVQAEIDASLPAVSP